VAGVTMKEGQLIRGMSRLAAAKEDSVRCGEGRTARLPPQDGELVAEHHDLELLEVVRPKSKRHQL
jgi:hypothetical protein